MQFCFLCLCSALSRGMRMVHMAKRVQQKDAVIESQQKVATWLDSKVSFCGNTTCTLMMMVPYW